MPFAALNAWFEVYLVEAWLSSFFCLNGCALGGETSGNGKGVAEIRGNSNPWVASVMSGISNLFK